MKNKRLTELADHVLAADLTTKTAQETAPAVQALTTDVGKSLHKLAHQIKEVANSPVDVSYADIAAFVKRYAP